MGCTTIQRRRLALRWAVPAVPAALLVVALVFPALFLPAQAEQEQEPEIQQALATMNRYRGWLGLQPMQISPELQAAAEAHAEYYRLNYGDPNLAGMGLHRETPGQPGFTGASMQDRADAQGYQGWVNENVGLSGSMLRSLDWFMDTINHRLPIIDPRYTEVGLATVNDGDVVFEVIMFGMPEYSENADPGWVVWPPDGTTGVGLSFWGEAPNPFPGATFPTGLPVTMSYFGGGSITLDSWSIASNGAEIASFGSVGTGFLSGRAALITAGAPLEYGTTYTISAAGHAGGTPFERTWSFTTKHEDGEAMSRGDGDGSPPIGAAPTATAGVEPPAAPPNTDVDPESPFPPGLQQSPSSVQELWSDLDGALYEQEEVRSWLLGVDVWATGEELYQEQPDGTRDVYYFDKARVEVADERALKDSALLTSGLLVRDMVLGSAQTGDAAFAEVGPADIPLAGDPLELNPDAPTYASLTGVATLDGDNRAEPRFGGPITMAIDQSGSVTDVPQLAEFASFGSYYPETGHNVAAVFEEYFATLPEGWWELLGVPITEPYWARVRVDGEPEWVLVQAFERRLLTFTPSNAPEWQVEMGNVGRHYYSWRYAMDPPATPHQLSSRIALSR